MGDMADALINGEDCEACGQYTGWFQGMRPYGHIKGRGIYKLLKQLRRIKTSGH